MTQIPRILISSPTAGRPVIGDALALPEDSTHHLRNVLRLSDGAALEVVVDGTASLARCRLANIGKASQAVVEHVEFFVEQPYETRIFVGLPKGERSDWIVEKATEIGASMICLWQAERSVVKVDGPGIEKKLFRWRKLAQSAAEQSLQLRIPRVELCASLTEALRYHAELPAPKRLLVCALTNEARPIRNSLAPAASVSLFIGPEGDFSETELQALRECAAEPVSLGSSRLRVETAAIAAATLAVNRFETPSRDD